MHVMMRNGIAALALGAMVLGCGGDDGGDATGPEPTRNLNGLWVGAANLGNPRSTTLEIEQNGSAVVGALSVSGVTSGLDLVGKLDGPQLAWSAVGSCEGGSLRFDGSFGFSADGETMGGAFTLDAGCASLRGHFAGTMKITRAER